MIALLLLLQAATPAAVPPERFSILADPCAAASKDGQDIVVCGSPDAITPRLPMRDDRGPADGPVPSNPQLTAVRALESEGTPCAARQGGCTVGFGPPVMPIIEGAVGLVKDAFAKKPDKRGRVPIDLSEP